MDQRRLSLGLCKRRHVDQPATFGSSRLVYQLVPPAVEAHEQNPPVIRSNRSLHGADGRPLWM